MAKSRGFIEAEDLWSKATNRERLQDWEPAFHLYLQAADAFLNVSKKTKNATEKVRSNVEAAKALDRAGKLKERYPHLRPPARNLFSPQEQQNVLDASANVNGIKYFTWIEPIPEEDPIQPPLSSVDTWQSANDALHSPPMLNPKLIPSDIIQSVVPNCSVVASLVMCWNHHVRHGSNLLLSRLYPRMREGIPTLSRNHKYRYRMVINGCDRRITLDDMIPTRQGKPLCVTSVRANSLWPSLVEKAYLTYNGGYDFAGSDPGVDLRALIGWIPEQHFFRSSTFERERMWKAIVDAFPQGNVLLALATSVSSSGYGSAYRLLPFHAYACIDVEDNDDRIVTIVNPWRRTMEEQELDHNGSSIFSEDSTDVWHISWDDICNMFDSVYLIWNPRLFPYVVDHHRFWKMPRDSSDEFSPELNHQIRLHLKDESDGEVWALLSRHHTKRDEPVTYIALHAFEEEGRGVGYIELENLTVKGQYQEGMHCLVKLSISKHTKAISLIASLNVPYPSSTSDVAYTLTVYSKRPIGFDETPSPNLLTTSEKINFTSANSGGNLLHATFFKNPQWKLKIPQLSSMTEFAKRTLLLRGTASKDTPLNIKVYRTDARRMDDIVDGHLVLDSGVYNFGLVLAQAELPPGSYIVVLSTFTPGQESRAILETSSHDRVELTRAPIEGAGMHLKTVRGRWEGDSAAGAPSFGRYWINPTYELILDRATEIILHLQAGSSHLPINLSLFQSCLDSPAELASEMATSGPYRESLFGVRIPHRRVPAGTYLLVASTHSPGLRGDFSITCWSDSPVGLQRAGDRA